MSVCAVCGGFEVAPYTEKNDVRFVKCPDCGYVVADPMPSADELDELYGRAHFESSYDPRGPGDRELFEKRREQYLIDRDLLLEHVSGGRVLDYGCGNGLFLSTFPDSFEKHGYEKNPVTTAWIRSQGGLRVYGTEQELEALEPGSFDVVMMRGVIEHLIEPERSLERLVRLLRQGGVFYVCATPNVDSPGALLYGDQWNQFTPPYHLHFFSPRTLGLLGARHGLALVDTRFPYLGTPYAEEARDGARFCADARERERRGIGTCSPPFPGTMMSLVFRRMP